MQSIHEMSLSIKNGGDSALVIGNYLDEFKVANDEERMLSAASEPVECPIEKASYIAAVVEHLCFNYNLNTPEWVNKEKYFLKSPLFYSEFENLKATLIQESPAAFRRRNIFVSANALSRA